MSKVVRFGAGTPSGARSSVFRVWSSPGGDVYVAARSIAGDMKASLHKSGRWRVAFTERHAAKHDTLVPEGRDRVIHKWSRPDEFAPGLTRAFTVVIPWVALVEYEEQYVSEQSVVWLAPPSDQFAQHVFVILARDGTPVTVWPGRRAMGTTLVGAVRAGDETAWCVAVLRALPPDDIERVERVSKGRVIDNRDGSDVESVRAVMVGEDNGAGTFWDVPLLGHG